MRHFEMFLQVSWSWTALEKPILWFALASGPFERDATLNRLRGLEDDGTDEQGLSVASTLYDSVFTYFEGTGVGPQLQVLAVSNDCSS